MRESCSRLSIKVFKTSKDGACTTSLNSLFHCLSSWAKFHLHTQLDLLLFQFMPTIYCPLIMQHHKELWWFIDNERLLLVSSEDTSSQGWTKPSPSASPDRVGLHTPSILVA